MLTLIINVPIGNVNLVESEYKFILRPLNLYSTENNVK